MHPTAKGDLTLAMLTARFLWRGWVVLKPVSELSRYDLVIDRGKGFERIQCKTGRLRGGGIKFNTCSLGGRKGLIRETYVGEIEAFGVYSPELEKCYLVPVEEVGVSEGVLRVTEAKNGMKTRIRWAKDFEV